VDIVALGYTKLSKRFIFRDKAVLYANAILLVMEMDPHRIDTAPSRAAFVAVHETYHHLGVSANQIAAYLRERGYAAQAAHPLFGLALYPPLAQEAGLGWLGLNGLLITPEYGPCVRLAAVFTSIENLPFCEENEHAWIEAYCQRCRVCVAKCPPQAILEQPVRHDTGLITCIEREKCFPYFVEQYGCSICVRVCPFHKTGYAKLKRNYDRRHKNRQ
jgi:epoxyqueuosine reductase